MFAEGTSSTKSVTVEPFTATLEKHGLSLVRGQTQALQVNTGLLCNLRCRHCHMEAGPDRREVMSRETMAATVAFDERFRFQAIDITGGAPFFIEYSSCLTSVPALVQLPVPFRLQPFSRIHAPASRIARLLRR